MRVFQITGHDRAIWAHTLAEALRVVPVRVGDEIEIYDMTSKTRTRALVSLDVRAEEMTYVWNPGDE